VSILLSNGKEKTIPNVLHVPSLMKKKNSIKKLDGAKGEMIIKS